MEDFTLQSVSQNGNFVMARRDGFATDTRANGTKDFINNIVTSNTFNKDVNPTRQITEKWGCK